MAPRVLKSRSRIPCLSVSIFIRQISETTRPIVVKFYVICGCFEDEMSVACIINIFLLACSITFMGLGSTIFREENQEIPRFASASLGTFAIVTGFFMLIFFICGVCLYDAYKNTYYVSVAILMILQILALAATIQNNVYVYTAVKTVFDDYVHDPQNENNKKIVDSAQQAFECCGVEGPQYWISSGFKQYPASCYKLSSTDQELYGRGCVSSIRERRMPKFNALGGIAAISVILEGLDVIYFYILNKDDSSEWRKLLG
ncbi:23 kDa integral membrane protein-like isoform X2 [Zophobas morio]|uniref:23 kDa integral membrane protein-like isoform X2 n=1 Tax=Zophobas morio TaxID=2755281 RepID=UPI0030833B4B